MASRAHAVHDYPFATPHGRARRDVWYRADDDDPVVLPRSKIDGISARSALAALIASGLVVASSYALFSSPSPQPKLGETAAAPLWRDWQPNLDVERANVTNQLSGPALAVPSIASPTATDFDSDTPITSPARPDEVIIDDSLQLKSDQPTSQPAQPPEVLPAPYPNPTTTPPEGVAPDASPATPTPSLDPENPYR
jgi:hypothetical protein